jgi:hypothetical protein
MIYRIGQVGIVAWALHEPVAQGLFSGFILDVEILWVREKVEKKQGEEKVKVHCTSMMQCSCAGKEGVLGS